MIIWLPPLLIALGAAAIQLSRYPGSDVAWLLYATREVLHGARLGTDLLENTPPMIFALKLPAVWLAGWMGVSLWVVWASTVVIGVLATIVLAKAILPQLAGRTASAVVGSALLAGSLLLLPGGDFGQREHLATILVLPYVLLAARRLSGAETGVGLAVLAGVLAGLGIGIKPHFVLVMAGLVLLEVVRLGWRQLLDPEHLVVVAVGVAYLGLVGVFAPGYFGYARAYGPLYQHFLRLPLWAMPLGGEGVAEGLIGLGCYLALRRGMSRESRALADALAMTVATFYLVAVLQAKGWRYHFLPSIIFSVLLVGEMARRSWQGSLNRVARLYLILGTGMLGVLGALVVFEPAERISNPSAVPRGLDPNLPNLLPLVEATRPHAVAVFSSNIASSYPLLLAGQARSAFRYPSLWPLVAFYGDSLRPGRMVVTHGLRDRGPLEMRFVEGLLNDLETARPGLVLVLRPDSTEGGWGAARRFDYLGYFGQDPGFRLRFDRDYTLVGRSGLYDVYARASLEGLGVKLESILHRTPPQRSPPSDATLRLLVACAGFLVGAAGGRRAGGGRVVG